ncbi:MAG: hypothetical protein ACYSUQ_09130 [Planctomycetota bacterium]
MPTRAEYRDARRRRRRVQRSVLVLMIMTAGLVAVVAWHRNAVRLAYAGERFEHHLVELMETYEAEGTLPLFFPPRRPDQTTSHRHEFRYLDEDTARCLRDSDEPLIVAHSPQIRQILRADVHFVAIKRGGDIKTERWPAGRFRRELAAQEARTADAIEQARRAGPQLP